MPRKKLIRQNQYPYHVVNRSNNKEWFALPLCDVWEISRQSFLFAYEKYPVQLHAYVLMSNHYHMLLTTPKSDIDHFMWAFNLKFSRILKEMTGNVNRMFGGPYKWQIVTGERYCFEVINYIYQNPVRANMVKHSLHYPYSTESYFVENKPFAVPLMRL